MSRKRGIWAVGLPLLDWCKRAAGRDRRAACRFAGQLQMVGQENQTDAAQVVDADFTGKPLELREFTKVLSIGDRVRVLCDDGVLVAEKISETEFKFIHAEMLAELVH